MMKTPPPRRNYEQMVRVVREGTSNPFSSQVPYQLGKAYGKYSPSAAETRIRSLDEIGIQSRSPNILQTPATDNNYNRRESTTLYHELSADQKLYFDGMSPNPAPTSMDARPGTKSRTYLGSNAASQQINVKASDRSVTATGEHKPGSHGQNEQGYGDSMQQLPSHGKVHHSLVKKRSTNVDTRFTHPTPAPKKTGLPVIRRASLDGVAKTGLDFCLSF